MQIAAPVYLRSRQPPAAPPWLWFWLVTYLFAIPGQLDLWRGSLAGFADAWSAMRAASLPGMASTGQVWLGLLGAAVDLLPALTVTGGLAVVLVPGVRGRWVERANRLSAPGEGNAALAEIQAFVHQHAPGVSLMANLRRARGLAQVYPAGYGRTNMAVFGGLVRLWRADRPAAEAVLRHEIGHYRSGDALIVGLGSPFERGIQASMAAVLALGILVLGLLAYQHWAFRAGMPAGFGAVGEQASPVLAALAGDLPGLSLLVLAAVWRLVAFLLLPLMGIWAAELNADRQVVDALGAGEGVCRALSGTAVRPPTPLPRQAAAASVFPRQRWPGTAYLSHPPAALRRWLARRPGPGGLAVLLLVYPLGYLLRLLALHFWATLLYLMTGRSAAEIGRSTLANTATYLAALRPVLLGLALLLAAWPWLQPYWTALVTHRRPLPGDPGHWPIYLAGAAGAAALALLG